MPSLAIPYRWKHGGMPMPARRWSGSANRRSGFTPPANSPSVTVAASPEPRARSPMGCPSPSPGVPWPRSQLHRKGSCDPCRGHCFAATLAQKSQVEGFVALSVAVGGRGISDQPREPKPFHGIVPRKQVSSFALVPHEKDTERCFHQNAFDGTELD